MFHNLELGLNYTNEEIKEQLRKVSIPERILDHLFYKDKRINFYVACACITLTFIFTLLYIIIV